MRKLFILWVAMIVAAPSFSQDKSKSLPIVNRPADHFLLQLSNDWWQGAPDSIKNKRKGLSRGANIYLMLNKPFRGNPRMSVAIGIGVGTSSIYFDKLDVDVAGTTRNLAFTNLDTLEHFKKYKVVTSYLEIPLELRYTSNPQNPNKSFKAAIGIKGGTLLKSQTKGKKLQNANGNEINDFTQKNSSKRYFNTTRLAATARFGYGFFSLFGSYNLTSLFKDGVAADMKPVQIGLTISGL
jgi:hypothetical protein